MKQDLPLDALNNWYKELAEVTSIEISYKIYQCFRGMTVTLPMRFISIDYLKRYLRKHIEPNGFLSKQDIQFYSAYFQYSERHLKRLIREIEKKMSQKE